MHKKDKSVSRWTEEKQSAEGRKIMPGQRVYLGFDACYKEEGETVWRLCTGMTCGDPATGELIFQSLLRLAARDSREQRDDRTLLLSSGFRLCEDWYYRKSHRRPKDEILRKRAARLGLSEDQTTAFLRYASLPLRSRAAGALFASGKSREEIASLLGNRAARVSDRLPGDIVDCLRALSPTEDELSQLSDNVYLHFETRSVSVENKLHAFRSGLDRAAPFLALGVLALFALALWVTR